MKFISESTDRPQQIITGKRTDFQIPESAISMSETTSSSNTTAGNSTASPEVDRMLGYYKAIHSTTIPSEEEEDMANCLIMLAQSTDSPCKEDKSDICCMKTEKLKIRSVTEMACATTAGETFGCRSYECKTCNRAFPSFQALGGHRASHKKPKLLIDDTRDFPSLILYEQKKVTANKPSSPPETNFTQIGYKNSTKPKVHECSICGSEFLSGQALGGHMRRHRTPPPSISPPKVGKSPVLSLDLNLPPPEVVDDGHSKFQFTASSSSQQRPLVFSATALVDCHY